MGKKHNKRNSGILDRKRFKKFEMEHIHYLQSMSPQKSIRIMEDLLDSGIMHEFKRIQRELNEKN